MAPRNRKGRRAVSDKPATNETDAESIPLARPSESLQLSNRDMKSLYEIAAERQLTSHDGSGPASSSAKRGKTPEFIEFSPSGKLQAVPGSPSATADASDAGADDDGDAGPIPPLPDTILTSLPLSVLHGTLSFVAAHLYLQETSVSKLVKETLFIAFPALTFLVHLVHGHIISFDMLAVMRASGNGNGKSGSKKAVQEDTRPASMRTLFQPTPRNFIFLLISIILGAQLIAISNDAAYYAVMKKAPPVGTLWVWCALEMSPGFAALGLLLPMGWAVLWKGYGVI